MDNYLNSPTKLKITVTQAISEIVKFMKSSPEREYKITIGTDSEQLNGGADFVTAIVVHRIGNGGIYFWKRHKEKKCANLRDRIIREVVISIDSAKEILEEFKRAVSSLPPDKNSMPKWNFEIHIDIGENGPTKLMIQEVVNMVRAYNFEAITKPGSYAASNVADKYV